MNPLLLLAIVAGAVILMQQKNKPALDTNSVDMLRKLTEWGYDVAQLTAPELAIVFKFISLERQSNFAEADKLLDQVKAIARKYNIQL